MKRIELGRSGIGVPVLGQGTYQLENFDRGEVIHALRRGIDAGMNHLDTAYEYGLGVVESEIVAEAIAGQRDGVFVTSKVLPAAATYEGTIAACESTLQRLRTNYLDMLLLHWWEDNPLEETIAAFKTLSNQGKIRAFGLSNLDVADLKYAISLAGEGQIACNQICYNLQMRNAELEMLPFCKEHGITMTAFSPFGDHSTPSTLFDKTLAKGEGVLESIAEARGVSTRNVALAFLLRSGSVLAIPKAEKVEFTEDNARAGDLVLTEAEIEAIDAKFPLPTDAAVPWCKDWEPSQLSA